MARITRKELKTDKFALEVGHTVDFFEHHRQQIVRYGAIVVAGVLIVLAVFLWMRHQRTARQQELARAIQVQEAPVGANAQAAPLSFPTQEAKDKEAVRLFSELAARHSGKDEGLIAQYYLGAIAANQGNLSEAEKHFQQAAASGDEKYASLAKLSLGQIYFATDRPAEGEKMLRSLIDNPTIFVSKEQATIALARSLARTKPEEARRLLEPLRGSRTAISQLAIQLYGELTPR